MKELNEIPKKELVAEAYALYREKLVAYAYKRIHDMEDAEDAVQNAFLQVIHHFDEISGIPCKKLGFWIIGDIPEYTITELPEGYVENQEERIAVMK